MSRTKQIDSERVTTHAKLADAKQQQAALSLQLTEQPANAELHAQLDVLDADIAGYEKALARLAAARELAAARDLTDARQASIATVQAALQAALGHANDRVTIAEQIDGALFYLGGRLLEWQEISRKVREETVGVTTYARISNDQLSGVLDEATAPFVPGAFLGCLNRAGIGTVGIRCHQHFQLPFNEENISVEDAARLAAARLLARLKPMADRAIRELTK